MARHVDRVQIVTKGGSFFVIVKVELLFFFPSCKLLSVGYCVRLPPRKLTCPLKNSGWKLEDEISFWDGPFFGDMLIFKGGSPGFRFWLS